MPSSVQIPCSRLRVAAKLGFSPIGCLQMTETFRIDREEITVRLMEPADAPEVFACRTDPAVAELQGWFPESEDEVRTLAERQAGSMPGQAGCIQLVIEYCGTFVGDIGICGRDDGRQAEFGISVLPEHHGHGYATIACRMIISWLFANGLHRVSARIDPRNAASRRLLERLDFRKEGHERKSWWDANAGAWTDELVYAVLAEEWPSF